MYLQPGLIDTGLELFLLIVVQKALNLFNAALVTPTYYVFFTSSTIITSAVLFRGFNGTPSSIATVVMGFLQICSGVVLLQLSKSSKDVPDTEIFRGDLDQVRRVAEQSEPESEPKADAIRGTAAIIRRISVARQKIEQEEAMRIREERLGDLLRVPGQDGEVVEWDGVRRRVTWGGGSGDAPRRRNTMSAPHPPLGMSRMPDLEEGVEGGAVEPIGLVGLAGRRRSMSVDEAMRQQVYDLRVHDAEEEAHPQSFVGRVRSLFVPRQRSRSSLRDEVGAVAAATSPHRDLSDHNQSPQPYSDRPPPLPLMDYTESKSAPQLSVTSPPEAFRARDFADGSPPPPSGRGIRTVSGGSEYTALPVQAPRTAPGYANSPVLRPLSTYSTDSGLRPESADPQGTRRQFSFQSVFGRHSRSHSRDSHGEGSSDVTHQSSPHPHLPTRLKARRKSIIGGQGVAGRTEEEMLGLVKGDSRSSTMEYEKDIGSARYVESDDSEEERERMRKKEWDAESQGRTGHF